MKYLDLVYRQYLMLAKRVTSYDEAEALCKAYVRLLDVYDAYDDISTWQYYGVRATALNAAHAAACAKK